MKTKRRILAASLIVIGALLLWLATESLGGLILIGLGVLIEIIGIAVERKGRNSGRPIS